jgi:hypothetical protein
MLRNTDTGARLYVQDVRYDPETDLIRFTSTVTDSTAEGFPSHYSWTMHGAPPEVFRLIELYTGALDQAYAHKWANQCECGDHCETRKEPMGLHRRIALPVAVAAVAILLNQFLLHLALS